MKATMLRNCQANGGFFVFIGHHSPSPRDVASLNSRPALRTNKGGPPRNGRGRGGSRTASAAAAASR
ncbi:hypothetical protein GWI33_010421 [Rhynchophorus ferrugineus]|uniref:Uncharacterized protein n=1 Tax=Rhynchophorus ferrugineus TaxID=354439 RepID=A0A834MKF6_RHYFE|nr:hypothetical protein GWI33_010421 [Rhynchophorus ferrugineus]